MGSIAFSRLTCRISSVTKGSRPFILSPFAEHKRSCSSAMGPVFADFENDGKVGIFVSDSKYNRMYRNLGGLMFDDITERAGISQSNAQYVSWGNGVQDFDNDGLLDIFIAHGGLIHMVPQEPSIFRNAGKGKFLDVSATAGPFFNAKTGVKTVARGAAFADYDND